MTSWFQVCDGLFIGEMHRPIEGEFDAVLAISPQPPASQDNVRHRWLQPTSPQVVKQAGVTWLAPRWLAGQVVLAQSIPAAWAELAAGACLMHLGATADEAISLLRLSRPPGPSDSSLLDHLKGR